MSYIIKQKIKNFIYVYKATAYWDKTKKQSRQKRILLGKEDTKTKKLIPSKLNKPALWSKEFGISYLFDYIVQKCGLLNVIKNHFPGYWQEILACAYFEVAERRPLYLCEIWSEQSYSKNIVPITSQRISELLRTLGENERAIFEFTKDWAKLRTEYEYLLYSITL